MKGFDLILTLMDDCVFSERAATEGGHRGLDSIPGATLLGAAAARLYAELSHADAFTLFHSGQVRFGTGLPLGPQDERAWPMPLCWHQAKGMTADQDGQLVADHIWRLGTGTKLPGEVQPQQLRQGYVTTCGALLRPREALRLKTAIDPTTGQAREGALFGYESVSAGQRFTARITADEAVPDFLLDRLRQALSGRLVLGRSRSAEYGRVQVQVHELLPKLDTPSPSTDAGTRHVTLWLLSDLVVLDPHGQPTLAPRPEWLGLPQGELVVMQTFVRSRRYSPWNAHRGSPDLERQVISQGSILVFDLTRPLNDSEWQRIAAGLGAHREAGLGQVWLNPPWLGEEGGHPCFAARAEPEPSRPARPHKPPLIHWLEGRRATQETRGERAKKARAWAKEYRGLLGSARRFKGLADRAEVGPSASQWGSVLQAAKTRYDLAAALFHERDGVCKPTLPGWRDEFWSSEHQAPQTFATWLDAIVRQEPHNRLVQMLAREILDVIRQESGR